jgi:hypothetical protein
MPKKLHDINYPVYYIVRVLDEWEELTKNKPCSQTNFAKSKNIALRTFRSWLTKRKNNVMKTMVRSNQIAADREPKPEKRNVLNWLTIDNKGANVSVADIVGYMDKYVPSLTSGKSYDCKRRIGERIKTDWHKKHEWYVRLENNIPSNRAVTESTVKLVKCSCKKSCRRGCRNRRKSVECDDKICRVGNECGNRDIQKKNIPPIEKKETAATGWGVFVVEDIKRDAFICEYVGEIIEEVVKIARERRHRNTYVMELDNGLFIDSFTYGNISRFVNHSCSPNAVASLWTVNNQPRVALHAKTNIIAGEQVTFNYGFDQNACKCEKCLSTKD